jgi:uncharacterized protein YfdQ (DUF2303 family)
MTTEAQTVADLAVKARDVPRIITTGEGREYLVSLHDQNVQDVTEPNAIPLNLPDHIAQGVTLQTVESLIDYMMRFKVENSVLFADIQANSIAGLIDYHGHEAPAHVAHRATMVLPLSEEWRLWTGISGKLQDQLSFARFIEENGGDIAEPSGADVLEVMRDLQARRKVNFTKAVRTSSDNENFEFTDETEMKSRGGVEVPTRFKLTIPVYFGEAATDLYAFLRWKLDEGQLQLGIQLNRAEFVRQAVFQQIVLEAAHRTGCPAMFGKLA